MIRPSLILTESDGNISADLGASPNRLGALAALSIILSKATMSTAPIWKQNVQVQKAFRIDSNFFENKFD